MNLPIYFISDVHFYLKENELEKEKIAKVSALFNDVIEKRGTLFIVGDFFDFWFDYQSVIPRHFFSILSKLKEVREAGCEIHYIVGNHDYWHKDFFTHEIGAKVYHDPLITEIDGKRFLILHGDGIDENDTGYKRLKAVIRNKFFIKLFSLIPAGLAFRFARAVSHTSRKFDSKDPKVIAHEHSIMQNFVSKKFAEDFDCIVMGHYHQPEETHKDGRSYLNCGDWLQHFTYGIYDGKLRLKYWK